MHAAPGLAPGTLFANDYRIVAPLSAGGMGSVYVAEHRFTGQRCALKLMHPNLVEAPGLRERFAQEARIGGLIESDHVVRVLGAGVDAATGSPWIAMELLAGSDLERVLQERGTLTCHEALAIMEDVCHALGAAHRAGIVHRDLKPANLFWANVRRTRVPFTIKVLDFGIAKVLAAASHSFTQAGLGTPLWMAPEQLRNETVTPATDVWALGLVAYAMLAGRPYWRAASQPNATTADLFHEILVAPIVPASARAAEPHVRQSGSAEARLPAGFDGWFARCVARDPTTRFADATACFQAIEPILAPAVSLVVLPPDPSFVNAATAAAVAPPEASVARVAPSSPEPPRKAATPVVAIIAAVAATIAAVCAVVLLVQSRSGDERGEVAPNRAGRKEPSTAAAQAGCLAERCFPINVANPRLVDPIDLLPAARKAARMVDPGSDLERITLLSPSADGTFSLENAGQVVQFQFVGKSRSFLLMSMRGQLVLEPRALGSARTIGEGPFCTARAARRAAQARIGSAEVSGMTLAVPAGGTTVAWRFNTASLIFDVDGKSCAPR